MKICSWLLDLLFPPKCILCRKVLKKTEKDLCDRCRIETKRYKDQKRKLQFLDSFTAVWYYERNVRRSLIRYKFHGAQYYYQGYGRMLAEKLMQEPGKEFDLLTWIPVSKQRLKERGYDQVKLLAEALSRETGFPLVPTLEKIRDNPPQSGIQDPALRRANVAGAYKVLDSADVRGKRILLVDDILTTSATADEAAKMLRFAGAAEVHCAAIAAARK